MYADHKYTVDKETQRWGADQYEQYTHTGPHTSFSPHSNTQRWEAGQYEQYTRTGPSNSFTPQSSTYPSYAPPAYENGSRDASVPLNDMSAYNQPTQPTGNDATTRLAQYGSPYATNREWSPGPSEMGAMTLTQLPIGLRIKIRFARHPGEIFDPPCPSFLRPIPLLGQPTATNLTARIPPKGKLLAEGFKPHYPSHLLVPRDVSMADWARFLEDLEVAGRMTGLQQVVSNVAPVTMHLGATGYFVTKAIQKGMLKGKEPVVYEALTVWQERFFMPRGLKVDFERDNSKTGRHSISSSSTSDSSSDSDDEGEVSGRKRDKDQRRRDERARKEAKKSAQKEKREHKKRDKRGKRKSDESPMTLVVRVL